MTYLVNLVKNFGQHLHSKPLLRGMVTYSVTWPISSLIQQTFENENYSFTRALKFSLYGSFFVAPTLFGWMKFSCILWPKNTLRFALTKGLVEQISYGPFAMCSFFFIMTLLDGGSTEDGLNEIFNKLFPTWKISVLVWPTVQTINYTLIPEKNRVPFVGLCSLGWTVFLAFVKYRHHPVAQLESKSKD